jgi:hypothetical protein
VSRNSIIAAVRFIVFTKSLKLALRVEMQRRDVAGHVVRVLHLREADREVVVPESASFACSGAFDLKMNFTHLSWSFCKSLPPGLNAFGLKFSR